MNEPIGNTNQKRYNNYSLAIAMSVLAGIGVTLALLLTTHLTDGAMPEWLYQLLCAIFGLISVSQIVSGAGYTFTGADILTNEDFTGIELLEDATNAVTKKSSFRRILNFMSKRKSEFVGLVLGFLFALTLTIILVVKKAADIFAIAFPVVGVIASLLQNISMVSGLCSRLGRCVDYLRANVSRPALFRGENVNYVLSVLVGVVIGVVIASVFLGVAGVTSVMTAGGALPLWFGGAVFVLATVSTCASASGYIGRVFDFFLGKRTITMSKEGDDGDIKNRAKSAEKVGTLVGVSFGIILGVTLIATGLSTVPFMGLGLPVAAAGVIVMMVCISGMGGLGNRLGFMIDKFRKLKSDAEHVASKVEPTSTSEPKSSEEAQPLLSQKSNKRRRIRLTFTPVKGDADDDSNDFDSGRRASNSSDAESCIIPVGIPRAGSGECIFVPETHSQPIPRLNTPRLDASGDERNRLREKAESRKTDSTYTYNNAHCASGRGKQIERFGICRRLHHEAALSKGIDRTDQDCSETRAAAAA